MFVLSPDNAYEPHTAEKVRSLARLNDGRVCCVRILEESFLEQASKTFSPSMKKLTMLAREQLQTELQEFLEGEEWAGINTSQAVLQGRDFIAIIQKVLQDNHDLVIKSGSVEEGMDQLAMRLFRKCPCPVWIIQPSEERDRNNILAALDLRMNQEESRRLNRKIVELTHSLALREKVQAHYLHVMHLEYESMMTGPRFKLKDEEIAAMKEELRRIGEVSFDRLFKETDIQPETGNIHLLEGDPSAVIQRAIMKHSAGTLVMGTVARSGIPGLLIGNRAEKVLSEVNCTVLAVKPDGFVSPVKRNLAS